MRQARIAAALALLSACFARDSQVGGTTSDTSAEEGCTRTIGYWKNHAGGRGNNPDVVTQYLPIWLGTPGGTKSVEVTTAAQAIRILSMDEGHPSNGITKLRAQLLATKLNIKNGANPASIADTIAAADELLAAHAWSDWAGLTADERAEILELMSKLDWFNNNNRDCGSCKTCEDFPGQCGTFNNDCGGEIVCGCPSPQVCDVNTGTCCTPKTCASFGGHCGAFPDGCGGQVQCACPNGVCFQGTCCTPKTCANFPGQCGTFPDGCGGTVPCSCASGQACVEGTCCTPKTCEVDYRGQCGNLSDGCGGMIPCNCPIGQVCVEGECCTPNPDPCAGLECGTASDGCGGNVSCGTCPEHHECRQGACVCIPQNPCTGNNCLAQSDGCGNFVECECDGGLSCDESRGICCEFQQCFDGTLQCQCPDPCEVCTERSCDLWFCEEACPDLCGT